MTKARSNIMRQLELSKQRCQEAKNIFIRNRRILIKKREKNMTLERKSKLYQTAVMFSSLPAVSQCIQTLKTRKTELLEKTTVDNEMLTNLQNFKRADEVIMENLFRNHLLIRYEELKFYNHSNIQQEIERSMQHLMAISKQVETKRNELHQIQTNNKQSTLQSVNDIKMYSQIQSSAKDALKSIRARNEKKKQELLLEKDKLKKYNEKIQQMKNKSQEIKLKKYF